MHRVQNSPTRVRHLQTDSGIFWDAINRFGWGWFLWISMISVNPFPCLHRSQIPFSTLQTHYKHPSKGLTSTCHWIRLASTKHSTKRWKVGESMNMCDGTSNQARKSSMPIKPGPSPSDWLDKTEMASSVTDKPEITSGDCRQLLKRAAQKA